MKHGVACEKMVAELLQLFERFGDPKILLTDEDTVFCSVRLSEFSGGLGSEALDIGTT